MLRNSFILFVLFVITSGCRDRNTDRIPDVPVNIAINIYQPDFFNLTVPSGWVYITGGSRGIIVYRKSATEFVALERHSPYRPEDNCAVVVDEDNVLVSDPCSDSKWLIIDGTIVQGPTAFALETYNTSFSDPILYITN